MKRQTSRRRATSPNTPTRRTPDRSTASRPNSTSRRTSGGCARIPRSSCSQCRGYLFEPESRWYPGLYSQFPCRERYPAAHSSPEDRMVPQAYRDWGWELRSGHWDTRRSPRSSDSLPSSGSHGDSGTGIRQFHRLAPDFCQSLGGRCPLTLRPGLIPLYDAFHGIEHPGRTVDSECDSRDSTRGRAQRPLQLDDSCELALRGIDAKNAGVLHIGHVEVFARVKCEGAWVRRVIVT